MGWLSDKLYGKRQNIDLNQLREYQAQTQGLVDENLGYTREQMGIGRQMMDPQSQMNEMMRNLMMRNAATGGAQIGQQMQKMGAMQNMSPAQVMMQARMGMNQSRGQSANQYQQSLQDRFGQGANLLGQGIQNMQGLGQQQQGLDENLGNAYIAQVNAQNQARSQRQAFGYDVAKRIGKRFWGLAGQGQEDSP